MIKVSETRSMLRRVALTKIAGEYEALVNGYANASNNPGVRVAANANLAAGGAKGQAFKPTPRPQPSAAAQDAWHKAQDADVSRIRTALVAKAKNVVRPVVGTVSSIFKR